MYAIFEDGGHQYRVKPQDRIEVDLRELPEGTTQIEFNKVLLVGDEQAAGQARVGQPWVAGAKVLARVETEVKAPKVIIQKYARRKGYRLRKGHRQRHLQVTIEKIEA